MPIFSQGNLEFNLFLQAKKFYYQINSIASHFQTYVFGGSCRSFLTNTPTSDIDLKVVANEDCFLSKFPHFEKKINLSNKIYYTTQTKGIKIDVSLLKNDLNIDQIDKNNYFFNVIHYNLNTNSFLNLEQKKQGLLEEKEISLTNEQIVSEHFEFLANNPIIFMKTLRFFSQSDFNINTSYFNKLKTNFCEIRNNTTLLSSSIKNNEFYSIFKSKNPSKVINLLSLLFDENFINQSPSIKILPSSNTPLYINLAYIQTQHKSLFDDLISFFDLPKSLTLDAQRFLDYYFNKPIKNLSARDELLYKNYIKIIKDN